MDQHLVGLGAQHIQVENQENCFSVLGFAIDLLYSAALLQKIRYKVVLVLEIVEKFKVTNVAKFSVCIYKLLFKTKLNDLKFFGIATNRPTQQI